MNILLDRYEDYIRKSGMKPSFQTFVEKTELGIHSYNYFLKNGGYIGAEEEIIQLAPLTSKTPLDTQLTRLGCGGWNVNSVKSIFGGDATCEKGAVMRCTKTNKLFQVTN